MERKISIILPIHNEKDSLPIMVRLLNYTIIPKEIIIVYDDNNDNAIEVAKFRKRIRGCKSFTE